MPTLVNGVIPVITTRSRSGAGGAGRAPGLAHTIDAFAPPKAKLFETATSMFIARASLGT